MYPWKKRSFRRIEFIGCLFLLILLLCSKSPLHANDETLPNWSSQQYFIMGFHRLMNEGDPDRAEILFKNAIFSSTHSSLSREEPQEIGWVVPKAFYFLGKIHYDRAKNKVDAAQNIAWAKEYLTKADEYGMVYDKLHPPLLDRVNQEYPGIKRPMLEEASGKATVMIEAGDLARNMEVIKVNQYGDITKSKSALNKNLDLERGAHYKLKPDIQGMRRTMYGALTVLGAALALWLIRS